MYKKIIIIYSSNYTQRIKNYFDVDYLLNNGILVEYWNLSSITNNEHLSIAVSEGLVERSIESISEFKCLLKKNKQESCVYATTLGFGTYSRHIFHLLSEYKVDLLLGTDGCILNPYKEILNKRTQLFSKSFPKLLKTFLDRRFIMNTNYYRECKYVLISCCEAKPYYKVSNNTIMVPFNSGDYNNSILHKSNTTPIIEGCYIVFIDQYIPFHNDVQTLSLSCRGEKQYYRYVNEYLSKIEKKYDCPVVIAAHPSAQKYHEHNYFNGRKIYFSNTASLIENCKGAITHDSTAISFAVLFEKPIILIPYVDMSKETLAYCEGFKRCLNIPMESFGKETYEFRSIDIKAYQKYKYDYLTHPKVAGRCNGEIMLDILNGVK